MTLRRWDPIAEMLALREHLNRPYAEGATSSAEGFAIDMYEEDDVIHVEAEMPGVKPEDVDITIQGNALAIEAEKRDTRETKEGRFYRRESSYGSFYRTVPLPTTVDSQRAEAAFEDGILKIALPKSEEARPRRIAVNAKAATIDAKSEGERGKGKKAQGKQD